MEPHALVLVDLQNDYFPGGRMEVEGIEAAAANAARIRTASGIGPCRLK